MIKTLLKISLIIIATFVSSLKLYAQDIQFSQFYANVLYLNPAFTGNSHATRIIGHQRLQWPGLDAHYITSFVSLDHYFNKYRSGLGIYFLNDRQGSNILTSNEVSLLYAYEQPIATNLTIRAGAKVNYVSRSVNYSVLTFPDQFNNNGYVGASSQNIGNDRNQYFDISTGLILYSNKFWAGIAYDHMNTPNQSFYNNEALLPYKLDFTAGYRIDIQKSEPEKYNNTQSDIYLTPTVHYKTQGKSDQFDAGVYLLYNQTIVGLWYRGIPYLKDYNANFRNNESFIIQAGYKFKALSVCYSYDQTVSRLYQGGTIGSHEINVTYLIPPKSKSKKIVKKMPCPDFD